MSIICHLLWQEQRDKFTKSLKEMRYPDWVIHKKLGETKGLTSRYIIPARGSGKTLFANMVVDEDDETSKHVTFTRAKDRPKPNPFLWSSVLTDKDLIPLEPWRKGLDEQISAALYKEFCTHLIKEMAPENYICTSNPYDWKPIVRSDSYVFNNKYVYDNYYLYPHLVYGGFKDVANELVEKLGEINNDPV